MGKMAIDRSQSTLVDAFLRDEMSRGNRALRSVAPVVTHLLEVDGPNLVSDAILARLRGMISHLVDQLLTQVADQNPDNPLYAQTKRTLENALIGDEGLINHLYALALEGILTQSLENSASIDPVLSPLLQELIAAERTQVAELAMSALAAQSRFCQGQARMELALGELPHELLVGVLDALDTIEHGLPSHQLADARAKLKQEVDESDSRIALMARLATSMQGGAIAGLDLDHAGFALFASSAASLTRQDRERVIFACHEGQTSRLALILKAAGLDHAQIERQIAYLGGVQTWPDDFAQMSQARAIEALRDMGEV